MIVSETNPLKGQDFTPRENTTATKQQQTLGHQLWSLHTTLLFISGQLLDTKITFFIFQLQLA